MAAVSLLMVLRVKPLVRINCYLSSLLNNSYQKQTIREKQNILHYCVKVPGTKANVHDSHVKRNPKTMIESKITLLTSNDSMTVVTLEDAQKLAKRRNLILIKVEDDRKNSLRDTYELIQSTKFIEESETETKSNEENNEIKAVKLIQLSAKISMYDLDIKLKHIYRLLKKRHKVKLIINHNLEISDKILKYVELNIKQHGTIQKNVQSLRTVFTITPILNGNNNVNKNSNDINENIEKK